MDSKSLTDSVPQWNVDGENCLPGFSDARITLHLKTIFCEPVKAQQQAPSW